MGLDVTFHPLGRDELERWVLDVVDDPGQAAARCGELLAMAPLVRRVYDQFPGWMAANADPAHTFNFAAAAIAGVLGPYAYCRGDAISLALDRDPGLAGQLGGEPFLALGELRPGGPLARLPLTRRLVGNGSASGWIPPQRLDALRQALRTSQAFSPAAVEALEPVLRYAIERKLGLIEASDLVVPLANEFRTDPGNLRAAWRGNLHDFPPLPTPEQLDGMFAAMRRTLAKIRLQGRVLDDATSADLSREQAEEVARQLEPALLRLGARPVDQPDRGARRYGVEPAGRTLALTLQALSALAGEGPAPAFTGEAEVEPMRLAMFLEDLLRRRVPAVELRETPDTDGRLVVVHGERRLALDGLTGSCELQ